jgi:hypothetical protein
MPEDLASKLNGLFSGDLDLIGVEARLTSSAGHEQGSIGIFPQKLTRHQCK